MILMNFGDGLARWSDVFDWFINHMFIHFYHKISGKSLAMSAGQIGESRGDLHCKLTPPPCELGIWEIRGRSIWSWDFTWSIPPLIFLRRMLMNTQVFHLVAQDQVPLVNF